MSVQLHSCPSSSVAVKERAFYREGRVLSGPGLGQLETTPAQTSPRNELNNRTEKCQFSQIAAPAQALRVAYCSHYVCESTHPAMSPLLSAHDAAELGSWLHVPLPVRYAIAIQCVSYREGTHTDAHTPPCEIHRN